MAETLRIEIPIETVDNTDPGVSNATKKFEKMERAANSANSSAKKASDTVSKFDKQAQKTEKSLASWAKEKYEVLLEAKERISPVLSTLGNGLRGFAGKTWNVTMRAIEQCVAGTPGRTDLDCNVYDGHTIKSQPMGFWPKNEVIQYAVEQRIPICSVYGTPYQDKKGNWYFTGEQRTGCCVCGFGCHLEPVPNRLQRLRTSDNDKHRRMCEGCLQIKNHGMTYEQALNYAGIPTEEVQEDE